MKKTKIDWCDCTLNPVVGCKNGCEYCYARKINDRFHFVKDWSKPEYFKDKLEQIYHTKDRSIFMDSMSDISWWTNSQIIDVFHAISRNDQNDYIFLTKGIETERLHGIFYQLYAYRLIEGNTCIFVGLTVDKNSKTELLKIHDYDFLSIEPILEPIRLPQEIKGVKLIIIGAETGNREGKVVPKKEWIENIVTYCDKNNIKVFMKSSLKELMGAEFRQDELIWKLKKQSNGENK